MEKIKSSLIATVHYLSKDIGQRSYLDIVSLHKTATYIEALFSSFGYEPIRQPYAYRGNTYENIAVEAKGFDSSRNDLIVIGAHYDTVILCRKEYDDNAKPTFYDLLWNKLLYSCSKIHPDENTHAKQYS